MKKEIVFVGLSGGVDSAVSALRLKRQGYKVVGVFIKVWQPDFLKCDWELERLDAMRIAAHLDIPFLTLDAEEEYKRQVADYMIKEYQEGKTPNPDVMCNQYIKFGSFLDFAKLNGADKIATGHYARIISDQNGCHLLRGKDLSKDQSYFLWPLTQEQLRSTIYPIGNSLKSEVRIEAQKAGLPVFEKRDSQGICFLGHIDMKEFLSHFVTVTEGDVLNEKGNCVGKHDGALFYTLGQRHGFTITTSQEKCPPHYVIAKDLYKNTITVSRHCPRTLQGSVLQLYDTNVIESRWTGGKILAQYRYRQEPFGVSVKLHSGNMELTNCDGNVPVPPSGQSCVLYDGNTCVGGGIIG